MNPITEKSVMVLTWTDQVTLYDNTFC
jgi:hypothetical protein